jgi:hypothetical protein
MFVTFESRIINIEKWSVSLKGSAESLRFSKSANSRKNNSRDGSDSRRQQTRSKGFSYG